jgi:hypothetical protein
MAVSEKGGFSRIKNLEESQLLYVHNHLSKGGEVMTLTRHMQQEWKVFTDVAEKSLFQQLNRYRTYLAQSDTGLVDKVVNSNGAALVRMRRPEKLDVLERMQALFHIQEGRLQMFIDKEATIKMPMTAIDKVIMDMQMMLSQIQKVRFDLGMDAFMGAVPGGTIRAGFKAVVSPDGTVTTTALLESVSEADAILSRALIPRDMGSVEVVSGA